MEDTYRTRQYLKEMDAVESKREVRLHDSFFPYITISTRIYYTKRNKKTCYVDINYFKVLPDMNKFKKVRYHNVYSTGDNDWNPLVCKGYTYIINKDYKKELIEHYKTLTF